MSLQRTIFDSTIFKAICAVIGYLSFASLSFFVAVFLTALAFFSVNDQMKVIDTVYSPDGKLKAVVFAEASIPKYKNISVLGAQAILEKNRAGNVFSKSCQIVRVQWLDNHKLLVYCDGQRVNEEGQTFVAFDRDIEIDFQQLKGE